MVHGRQTRISLVHLCVGKCTITTCTNAIKSVPARDELPLVANVVVHARGNFIQPEKMSFAMYFGPFGLACANFGLPANSANISALLKFGDDNWSPRNLPSDRSEVRC